MILLLRSAAKCCEVLRSATKCCEVPKKSLHVLHIISHLQHLLYAFRMPRLHHDLLLIDRTACHTARFALLFLPLRPVPHLCVDTMNLLWSGINEFHLFSIGHVTHQIAKIARKFGQGFQWILVTIQDIETFWKRGEPSDMICNAI